MSLLSPINDRVEGRIKHHASTSKNRELYDLAVNLFTEIKVLMENEIKVESHQFRGRTIYMSFFTKMKNSC